MTRPIKSSLKLFLLVCLIIGGASCANIYHIDVTGYLDPAHPPSLIPGKTVFVVQNAEADNPLLEKEVSLFQWPPGKRDKILPSTVELYQRDQGIRTVYRVDQKFAPFVLSADQSGFPDEFHLARTLLADSSVAFCPQSFYRQQAWVYLEVF